MHKLNFLKAVAACLAVTGAIASAQTAVTTSGGTTNTVPLYTGSSTLGNSVITQLGSNVGVGTTAPVQPLDVNGTIGINHVPAIDETTISTPSDGTYVIASGGRVHGEYILTWGETPNRVQTVHLLVNANQYDDASTLQVLEDHTYPGFGGAIMRNFRLLLSSDHTKIYLVMDVGNRNGGSTVYVQYNGSAKYGAAFGGSLTGTETPTGVVVFASVEGNVGIGTTSPSAKLEVDGNIKLTSGSGASITFADGTVQSTAYTGVSCGGDYAESVDVEGKKNIYEPGDVLVISGASGSDVEKASEPYSTMVAGIYSTKPGYVGRRQREPKSQNEVPMAMVGIVPTKVSAENGPIHRGDLLVTSSTPGYAMKGTDHSRMLGAVVGKAMGNLNSGKGVMEVLVTLQ